VPVTIAVGLALAALGVAVQLAGGRRSHAAPA
jgi:hypothetical protein